MRIKNVLYATFVAVSIATVGYTCSISPPETVTYKVTADYGDTVWTLCSRVNRGHQDLQQLVWQTMQINHIDNPTHLTAGKELTIIVNKI